MRLKMQNLRRKKLLKHEGTFNYIDQPIRFEERVFWVLIIMSIIREVVFLHGLCLTRKTLLYSFLAAGSNFNITSVMRFITKTIHAVCQQNWKPIPFPPKIYPSPITSWRSASFVFLALNCASFASQSAKLSVVISSQTSQAWRL